MPAIVPILADDSVTEQFAYDDLRGVKVRKGGQTSVEKAITGGAG